MSNKDTQGKDFQEEGTTNAEVWRWECAWCGSGENDQEPTAGAG